MRQEYKQTVMKKCMLIVFQWPLVLLVAQTMQVRTDAGFFTGMKWQGSNGRFVIHNSPSYAAAVFYTVERAKKIKNIYFELQYAYTATHMHYEPYNRTIELDEEKVTIHSLQAGAGKKFGTKNMQPYVLALVGVTIFDPAIKDPVARFSLAFTGGFKVGVTPFMGLYLQAKALLPVMYNKVYTGWEPGVGLLNEVSPNGVAIAGYFSGGVYFNCIK
jgi:hypothetical protein